VRYTFRFWLVVGLIAAVAVTLLIWAGLRMDTPEQPPAAAGTSSAQPAMRAQEL
jgi:hypothetical protein